MALKPNPNPDPQVATWLIGEIDVSYQELVDTFGPPNGEADGYKTDAEWALETEDGEPVTIYNYKNGVAYNGPYEGIPVKDIREWHVGGISSNAMGEVYSDLAW